MKDQHPFRRALLLALGLTLATSPALADNWADRINLTGFASAKYQRIDSDNFFNGDNQSGIGRYGSFRGTMLGLNIGGMVDERISFASQIFATQEDDNYVVHLDWGFVAVALTERTSIRAGKLKFPTGLVNEYISVGNAYPWITPPMLFYTEERSGPNTTREAYTGANLYYETSRGDLNLSAELFGGEIRLEEMNVRRMKGLKLHLDWNEEIAFQASYYRGVMRNVSSHFAAMEGLTHTNYSLGTRLELADFIAYLEWSETDMEMAPMNGTSWYVTLGRQFGDWLPHVTYQHFEKGLDSTDPQQQSMTTVGVRYDLSDTADVKVEYSIIETDEGDGLFESSPPDDRVGMVGTAIDIVF